MTEGQIPVVHNLGHFVKFLRKSQGIPVWSKDPCVCDSRLLFLRYFFQLQ